MIFKYDLSGIGWAAIEIQHDNKTYFGMPSYLSEPLVDILDGLKALIPSCIPEDELYTEKSFKMYFEPAVEKWTFELIESDILHLKIESFESESREHGKVVFDINCSLVSFIEEVVKATDQLLKTHGIIGYKNTWYAGEFPISTFLTLKYYLQHRSRYPIEKYCNDWDQSMKKSDINKEFELIFKD